MSEFSVSLNGETLKLNLRDNGTAVINEKEYRYELHPLNHSDFLMKIDNKVYELHCTPVSTENFHITMNSRIYDITIRTALQEKAAKLIEKSSEKSRHTLIKAPMPGMVLKIKCSEGENVKQGEPLLILEAMKMENELRAPVPGEIKKIHAAEGSAVEKGTVLITIE